MKKIILLLSLLIFGAGFSQCYIIGNPNIKVGETENYTVEKDIAQCKDCHLWTIYGDHATVDGDVKQNSIKLKGNTSGQTILSLAMIAPQGMVQCSKVVDVVEPVKNITINISSPEIAKPNCDIDFSEYREEKAAEGMVSFSPAKTENNYKYEWTVVYMDGAQKQSTEKSPQFPYTKENGIVTVSGKIISTRCMRSFTKTYDSNYWKNF
ncbi:hypothetical protein [Chryseobacterium koreense]|uniref:hypothetical protein n=1 Tax=Chryseobacterium koreense TaxID=232216 RepID=UPI0026F2FA8C|nr:hypothetical protein [Chryseobacterium koreense]